jgi:DeoR/GlpR family transcriptional regulator of sugar metabolism
MPAKDTDLLNKRRECVYNRVSNAKYPSREIQRLSEELFISVDTIYKDLSASGLAKNNGFRY